MYDQMPSHPLITVDDELSSEELMNRITALRKKMNIVYSFPNPNVYVLQQLQLTIQSYSEAYQRKLDSERRDDNLDSLIDIE